MGGQSYQTDDESDAVAVGIAWLQSRNFPIENLMEFQKNLHKSQACYVSKSKHNDT